MWDSIVMVYYAIFKVVWCKASKSTLWRTMQKISFVKNQAKDWKKIQFAKTCMHFMVSILQLPIFWKIYFTFNVYLSFHRNNVLTFVSNLIFFKIKLWHSTFEQMFYFEKMFNLLNVCLEHFFMNKILLNVYHSKIYTKNYVIC